MAGRDIFIAQLCLVRYMTEWSFPWWRNPYSKEVQREAGRNLCPSRIWNLNRHTLVRTLARCISFLSHSKTTFRHSGGLMQWPSQGEQSHHARILSHTTTYVNAYIRVQGHFSLGVHLQADRIELDSILGQSLYPWNSAYAHWCETDCWSVITIKDRRVCGRSNDYRC